MTKRQQEPTQLDEWPTWREDMAVGDPKTADFLQQFANPQEFGKAVLDELGPWLDRRGPIAPILRQKIFWPADRLPVGYEKTYIIMQIYERIVAVSKYYKVDPGSPAWDATWQKAEKRFEGLKLMTYPGQTARPKQAYDDLALVYIVEKTVANGGTVTAAIKVLAESQPQNRTRIAVNL